MIEETIQTIELNDEDTDQEVETATEVDDEDTVSTTSTPIVTSTPSSTNNLIGSGFTFPNISSGLTIPTGSNSYNFGNMIESGFTAQHSFSDVFGAYNFGVSNYSANSYNISGYSNANSSVRQQSYSSVNSSSYYSTGSWFNVGNKTGYIQDFTSGRGANAGVLNFTSSNISSFRRESDFINFHMADGTSFQAQNSSSENEVIQYSTDGQNVSFAKLGYADKNNSFSYEDGVNFYRGGEHTDVLTLDTYDSRNIWLDGSRGVKYSGIDNIDASDSSGNNQLVGNSSSNEIVAGSGNDSLWGGSGNVDDVLYGGEGNNVYFYGKNNGNDTIINSTSSDRVDLFNVSLTDIVSANEVGQDFVVNMKGGQSLVIQGQDGASNFTLANRSTYNYNRETHHWSKVS